MKWNVTIVRFGAWATLIIGWLYSLDVTSLNGEHPEWADQLSANVSFIGATILFAMLLLHDHWDRRGR